MQADISQKIIQYDDAFVKSKQYEAVTRSNVHIDKSLYDNELKYLIKHTLLEKKDNGYIFQIEQLENSQTAVDPFSILTAEMNKVNKKITFQTDDHCNLLKILNKKELVKMWQGLKKELVAKYNNSIKAIRLFDLFERQLDKDDESLEMAMRHKGFYSLLVSGVYGYDWDEKFSVNKLISQFFGEVNLPVIVTYTKEPQEFGSKHFVLKGKGIIEEETFDLATIRQQIRQITGAFNFRVRPEFVMEERYEIDKRNGWLISASSRLKFIVPGFYYNEIVHTLTEKKA